MTKALSVCVTLLTISICQITPAKTWYVDGAVSQSADGKSWETAFKTIWEGIHASRDGDTVIVAPGTYKENVRFDGKNIVLRSTDPLDTNVVLNTIIDANGLWSVVAFDGTENETCVLSGFTIRNGHGSQRGGGIHGGTPEQRTQATIRNNRIAGNSASLYGGGIDCCDGIIENNIISNNSAYDGGGLADCDGIIRSNTITGNTAEYKGGGLFQCNGMIEGNTISMNSVDSQGGGLASCNGIIQDNTISGNTASWGAGLAYNNGVVQRNTFSGNAATNTAGGLGGCDGTVQSNVIVGNSAQFGGGIAYCGATIRNNTLVGNSATERGGGLIGCNSGIQNCIIWGSTAAEGAQFHDSSDPTYSCIQNWPGGGEGNTSEYPLFGNPAGQNYRLQPSSPCIDKGNNSFLNPPGLDRDGTLRIARGRDSLTVDMGAYEYGSLSFSVTDFGFVTIPWPGGRRLVWNSQPNDTYAVWSSYSLTGGWNKVVTVASQGGATSCTAVGLLPVYWRGLFYRVQME